MLKARPEVKRTYSRLKKETACENDETIEIETNKTNVSMTCEEFGIVKVDKMRKITDFFRVKGEVKEGVGVGDLNVNISSSSSSSSASSSASSSSNKLKQTYLDLGQKNLISVQCPDCLMHYNKSFPDDMNLHKKFHSNYLKGFNFNLKIDGETVKELAPKDLKKWSKFRFYQIKKFNTKLMKRFEFFLNFVHLQLGAEPLNLEELIEDDAIVVVEPETSKILAFALFEKCSKVFKSVENCDNSSIELESDPVSNFEIEFIGVSRIWVDERRRSIGLAGTLLDLKCNQIRGRVAFSQPTPAGFIFAKSYQKLLFNGKNCLIYLK